MQQHMLLIGHRGSGKTSLLRRLERMLPNVQAVDLDEWIEQREGCCIAEIFARDGEAAFRRMECAALHHLMLHAPSPMLVALGAGYEGEIPEGMRCIWVRRDTDIDGRVLLDRPSLSDTGQLAGYRARFFQREQRYMQMADEILTIAEHPDGDSVFESAYFMQKIYNVGGIVSISKNKLKTFCFIDNIKRLLRFGVGLVELRDDLLTREEAVHISEHISPKYLLWSYRSARGWNATPPANIRLWDWALELGPCPHGTPPICSLHERESGESLRSALDRLSTAGKASQLKAAPMVENIDELMIGHAWQQQDPRRRSFLPRSRDGRWRWYRLLMKGHQWLNFWREGSGPALDQPTLCQWWNTPAPIQYFAAVVGDPVLHSFTPREQQAHFASAGMPVFAITISTEEWKRGALNHLKWLGLRAAAVTSPLKTLAADDAHDLSPIAQRLGVANTLAWDETLSGWRAHNTDYSALEQICANLHEGETVAVWGGGSMLRVLQQFLPKAAYFAARTGAWRSGGVVDAPKVVLWCTAHGPHAAPPSHWRPDVVYDLNYRQNSPGLCYAERCGARYESGWDLFRRQAAAQRVFWKECGYGGE